VLCSGNPWQIKHSYNGIRIAAGSHTIATMPKALIFDLDGTLVDTLGDFEAALNRMLRDLHFEPVTRHEVLPFIGKGSEHLVDSVLAIRAKASKSHTLGPGYVRIAAQTAYQKHYRAINGQFSAVYPGVAEALAAISARGLPMACVTNKPTLFADALLGMKGMRRHFAHVFGGEAFARKKPDPMPIEGACAALGQAPADVWVVGDSVNDAQAARAAGAPCALVRWGYNHGEPVDGIDALAHLSEMRELLELL
jgi:phosphoglycolate phosphatase